MAHALRTRGRNGAPRGDFPLLACGKKSGAKCWKYATKLARLSRRLSELLHCWKRKRERKKQKRSRPRANTEDTNQEAAETAKTKQRKTFHTGSEADSSSLSEAARAQAPARWYGLKPREVQRPRLSASQFRLSVGQVVEKRCHIHDDFAGEGLDHLRPSNRRRARRRRRRPRGRTRRRRWCRCRLRC